MSANHGDDPKEDKPKSALASPRIDGQSPRPPSMKSVSIYEPDSISPLMRGRNKDVDSENEPSLNLDRQFRQPHRATVGRKVTARPSIELLQKARTPAELLKLRPPSVKDGDPSSEPAAIRTPATGADSGQASSESSLRHGHLLTYHDLMRWLQKEKKRRAAAKARKRLEKQSKKHDQTVTPGAPPSEAPVAITEPENVEGESSRRPFNASSEGSVALEMLREMLEHQMTIHERHPIRSLRSNHSMRSFKMFRRLSTAASSDTEFNDGDMSVPSCDVVLDNSKTLLYSGGTAVDNDSRPYLSRTVSTRERDAWKMFKREIIKIAHTLRLRGWRRVPLDQPDTINVERLSGALTNAVYVVSPSKNLTNVDEDNERPRKSKPRKLLLRIYGSQVDHLIDRESELQVLRRLSKKRIGPRLLGTFKNGRFEEFVNALALEPADLRIPEISRLIAKRVRELHDGIELQDSEIQAGPFVWQNINKWMARAERIVSWLESAVKEGSATLNTLSVKNRFVGSDFTLFKQALQKYQLWLDQIYKGNEEIKERLVFAHNDTQYGNILRMMPDGESPLLLPMNEHKQLVVIDFEYANANVPGHEFANHFTEWCYNYHDLERPFACNVSRYPSRSEQVNFISAYITHQPSFPPAPNTLSHRQSRSSLLYSPTPSYPSTPAMLPAAAVDSMSSLVLENPPLPAQQALPQSSSQPPTTAEEADLRRRKIESLMWETRVWRGLNSAQWVLWGIVQAKIPGFSDAGVQKAQQPNTETDHHADIQTEIHIDDAKCAKPSKEADSSKENDDDSNHEEEQEDGFDYLAYSRERAAFFWGDIISLGIMPAEELPEAVVQEARILDY